MHHVTASFTYQNCPHLQSWWNIFKSQSNDLLIAYYQMKFHANNYFTFGYLAHTLLTRFYSDFSKGA